ncbi:MAG TPA: hypothetical protein VFZ89_01035 [Solirubrobacteraceae bacterium]
MRVMRMAGMAFVAVLLSAASASADPGNDDRDDAQRVERLPLTVGGTLVDAGREEDEPRSPCADGSASVWYRIDPGHSRRIVARLRAAGDLDATLDVFERVRSKDDFLACDNGDRNGNATVAFHGARGHAYLVRVSLQPGSPTDAFRLHLVGAGAVRLPGPPLPPSGVSATLDRAQRTANAWALRLRRGVRYRIALTRPGLACIGGTLHEPGDGLRDQPVAMLGCKGYALYTPRRSGVHSIVVRAARGVRGPQRYFLDAGRTTRDDSAPGVRVDNYGRVHGGLGRLDRVDLLRFDVVRRSVLFLHLQTARRNGFDALLMDAKGRRIACACGRGSQMLHKGLHRGTYYVAVRNHGRTAGRYTLLRASRTITKSSLSISTPALAPLGTQLITVSTQPAIDGPVAIVLQQLDPLAGWQYVRTLRTQMRAGIAQAGFVAPSVGHWRAMAQYEGTRGRAPSVTGFAEFRVAGALHD